MVERTEQNQTQNIPRWYRHATHGLYLATLVAYVAAGSYLLAKNLERSKPLQIALPAIVAGWVGGAFAIRAGYSAAAKGLAKKLF